MRTDAQIKFFYYPLQADNFYRELKSPCSNITSQNFLIVCADFIGKLENAIEVDKQCQELQSMLFLWQCLFRP